MAVVGPKAYVTAEQQGVFVFSMKGRCLGFFAKPSDMALCDAICAAADGTLLVTESSSTASVRRLDPASGTWTTLVSSADDATLVSPRAICAAADGSFFVASRNSGWVRRYASDGSGYTAIGTFAGALSLALDGDRLFVGTRFGKVVKIDLADGNAQTTLAAPVTAKDDTAAISIALKDGRLWMVDTGAGFLWSLDPDTPYQTARVECVGFAQPMRGAFVDLSARLGSLFILR